MSNQRGESLSIRRPVYAPTDDAPLMRLCASLAEWADHYEGVKVYVPEGTDNNELWQELVTNAEIRGSLGVAAVRAATDPGVAKEITACIAMAETARPVTVASASLRTIPGTSTHTVRLHLHEHDANAMKYERLNACMSVQSAAERRGIKPVFELGKPLHPLSIKLMDIPKGTLSPEKITTLMRAIRAGKQMQAVLGSIETPVRRRRR
jgi:hypothetical protein